MPLAVSREKNKVLVCGASRGKNTRDGIPYIRPSSRSSSPIFLSSSPTNTLLCSPNTRSSTPVFCHHGPGFCYVRTRCDWLFELFLRFCLTCCRDGGGCGETIWLFSLSIFVLIHGLTRHLTAKPLSQPCGEVFWRQGNQWFT